MRTTSKKLSGLIKNTKSFGKKNTRRFPWRETTNPYCILVSEIMLQQTQASRVVIKYKAFLRKFPTVESLAKARLKDVLLLWQGLGYNRRAKSLHNSAKIIVRKYNGIVPKDRESLEALPGIGVYTAGAILVFAYNKKEVLIETNIREVFISHCFKDKENVRDKELFPLIEKTISENPRDWFNTLMDYGSYLKANEPSVLKKSKHYNRQSKFKGSHREVRGKVLKHLSENEKATIKSLAKNLNESEERVRLAVFELEEESLISKQKHSFALG